MAQEFDQNEIKAFLDLVRKMRHWQKCYFSTRSEQALQQSKYYEQQVDTVIQSVYEPTIQF